ncbi:hypothetical protein [Cellulomonas sp. B6]|uniref:hypothetical protein n=1 Tax=Cellulomonas sp. B6 TaxID=1295626 RepID=UPI0009E8DE8B|nr:hypothetical protein [Cellulomonas sp. B6]
MTTDFGKDGHALPAGLRERWRHESVASVWRRPSDWYHPAVDALAATVLAQGDPSAAAWDLGRARGEHGVGVGEALDDLVCLYRSTGLPSPPTAAVRALTEGWSDAQAALMVTGACTDPETGLPTQQYLAVRLEETYLATGRRDEDPTRVHGLAVVDVAAGHVTGLLRAARSAAVGAALRDAFGAGHPMATLGGGVFAVLTRAGDDADERIAALREGVARRCEDVDVRVSTRQPVRVWVEPLPGTHAGAVQRLAQLARPEPWAGIPRPAVPSDGPDLAGARWDLHDLDPSGTPPARASGTGAGPEPAPVDVDPLPLGLLGAILPPGLLSGLWPDGPPAPEDLADPSTAASAWPDPADDDDDDDDDDDGTDRSATSV